MGLLKKYWYVIAGAIVVFLLMGEKTVTAGNLTLERKDLDVESIAGQFGLNAKILKNLWIKRGVTRSNFGYLAYLDAKKLSATPESKLQYEKSFDSDVERLNNMAGYLAWCVRMAKLNGAADEYFSGINYYVHGIENVKNKSISQSVMIDTFKDYTQ